MMERAVLTPIGSSGDLLPFLWLGGVLASRGVEVTVIASPRHEAAVRASGFRFVALGTAEDYERMVRDPRVWNPWSGPRLIFRYAGLAARLVYDLVREEVEREAGAVVVFSPLTAFGARVVREKVGCPLVTVHLQPSAILSVDAPPLISRGFGFVARVPRFARRVFFAGVRSVINRGAAGPVQEVCREEGVVPPRDLAGTWWNSPDGVLGLFPEWFARPQADWPERMRCVGFPLFDRTGEAELARIFHGESKKVAKFRG